ncbi:MAG: hypothetical protein LBC43_03565 [Bifidobacteriaceae bacterium]|nr:hypothetical protein [Bifidobacteriaceae bacterium]
MIASVCPLTKAPIVKDTFDYLIPEGLSVKIGHLVNVRFGHRHVRALVVEIREQSSASDLKSISEILHPFPIILSSDLSFYRKLADYYASPLPAILRRALPAAVIKSSNNGGARAIRQSEKCKTSDVSPNTSLVQRQYLKPRFGYIETGFPKWCEDLIGQLSVVSSQLSVVSGQDQGSRIKDQDADDEGSSHKATDPASHESVLSGNYDSEGVMSGSGISRSDARAAGTSTDNNSAELINKCTLIVVPRESQLRLLHQYCESIGEQFFHPEAVGYLTSSMKESEQRLVAANALAGEYNCIITTTIGCLLPVGNLSKVVIYNDFDFNHRDERFPNVHNLAASLIRSYDQVLDLTICSQVVSPEVAFLILAGTLKPFQPDFFKPKVQVFSNRSSESNQPALRIPSLVHQQIGTSARIGPTLILVPQAGEAGALICVNCFKLARCLYCDGPLVQISQTEPARCRYCGRVPQNWKCSNCRSIRFRLIAKGSSLTFREIGRAFPGVKIQESSEAVGRIESLAPKPGIVVATPGYEPAVAGGYKTVVILDALRYFFSTALDLNVRILSQWFNVLYKVANDGQAFLVGEVEKSYRDALGNCESYYLIKHDVERSQALLFPPTHRIARIVGDSPAIHKILTWAQTNSITTLGPSYLNNHDPTQLQVKYLQRLIFSLPKSDSFLLAQKIRELRAQIRLDPTLKNLQVELDPVRL